MADVSCDEQRPVLKQKLDAVLMIGEPPALDEPNSSPYMFSIVGWKEGTQPGGTIRQVLQLTGSLRMLDW